MTCDLVGAAERAREDVLGVDVDRAIGSAAGTDRDLGARSVIVELALVLLHARVIAGQQARTRNPRR